jgi:hypothetical protein
MFSLNSPLYPYNTHKNRVALILSGSLFTIFIVFGLSIYLFGTIQNNIKMVAKNCLDSENSQRARVNLAKMRHSEKSTYLLISKPERRAYYEEMWEKNVKEAENLLLGLAKDKDESTYKSVLDYGVYLSKHREIVSGIHLGKVVDPGQANDLMTPFKDIINTADSKLEKLANTESRELKTSIEETLTYCSRVYLFITTLFGIALIITILLTSLLIYDLRNTNFCEKKKKEKTP